MSEDYTRFLNTHEKKSECFMTGTIVVKPAGEFDSSQGEMGSAPGTPHKLGNIPRDAFITNVHVFVQQPAALLTFADLGTVPSGLGSINLLTARINFPGGKPGRISDATDYVHTGDGLELWLNVISGSNNVYAKFVFVVEYTEYKLTTGKLTSITN